MDMDNNKDQSVEYVGYGFIANIHLKIGIFLGKISKRSFSRANAWRFEQYKMIFGERDDDIYIATYPKSGTTMTQVILYQLTTSGDMGFKHIYDVSPWIRNASFKKQEPIDLPSPRLIKTHDKYKEFHKGVKGRFIHVHREGKDVAVSLYNQNKDYNNNNLKFEDFFKDFIKKKSWFKYSKYWFRNKKGFQILYLRYEDLINNKEREIHKIIEFLNLDVKKDAIDRAIKYSSFDYMKKNESKFGEQPPEKVKHKKRYDNFIRKGKIGEGKNMFDKDQAEKFNKYYKKMVKPFEK